ncbi:hypothetical protein [Mesorhizobium sp. WSM3864]|uniref:ATP-dependent DNA ligase n=1 Tax=Mesorhizobium sp. WSM3864 TaxID=2029404 RepID=UPI001FE10C4A|nr:hypothetical protein [Mesorhizobium sp. WSM3864]
MTWNAKLLAFVAFDILHLDGQDLRSVPLVERKAKLWNLVKPARDVIQYSDHVEGGGAAFFEAVENMGLEGISKRRDRSGRVESGSKPNVGMSATSSFWASSESPGSPLRRSWRAVAAMPERLP